MIFKHDGSDFNFQTFLDGKLVLRKEDRHMATLDTIQEVKAFICGYRERAHERADNDDILPEWTPWEVARPTGNEAWIKIPKLYGDNVFYSFLSPWDNWAYVNYRRAGAFFIDDIYDIGGIFWKPIIK